MNTKYTVIRPDGTEQTHQIRLPAAPTLQTLRSLIVPHLNGGDLEQVGVLHNGKGTDMFVDEEGLLKRLPRNDKATDIYRAHYLKQHPGIDPEQLGFIAGTAVIFDRRVWF
ncbi:DUF3846 domain-containing protein [Pseudomonas sp. MG-2]|uniref:DUF3846 domain-containing protein n=1 Tax=Pseudomonas sp. MG-2 TaxID=405714 RepID=UPI001C007719|nr:DUF3846 domain-containing protein [Pseudomonas sp. MG-2]MBT9234269.1 DUF3846 domain-containing protein [Pseudomonas sp. MG-2]